MVQVVNAPLPLLWPCAFAVVAGEAAQEADHDHAPPSSPTVEALMRIAVRVLDDRVKGWGFPRRGSAHSAGLDLFACLDAPLVLAPQAPAMLIPSGLAVMIRDPDWCGFVLPRSGLGHRDGLVLGNGTGVIDADYEGPLLISAWNRNPAPTLGEPPAAITIEPGDRIAQLVVVRVARPEFEIVDEADAPGERGSGGFGSSGRR